MKKLFAIALMAIMLCFALASCSSQSAVESAIDLEDGEYLADFDTDSSMFHVNEAMDGKAQLTVENGKATAHLIMPSKRIVNLYLGLKEDAQKDGAQLIEPITEEVTYDDGMTEETYAFDLPVPVIDEEFDVALIGTHDNWYNHKVIISNPERI